MPTNCHTEISAIVRSAVSSWPSHGPKCSPSPTSVSSFSLTPHSGDRISCQVNPMITTDSSVGRNSTVR